MDNYPSIADHNDASSNAYPSRLTTAGNRVHVFERDGEWDVWLNTEDMDFTGLCIGSGETREAAVADAVAALEAAVEILQRPENA
jgi:hypothetical protein